MKETAMKKYINPIVQVKLGDLENVKSFVNTLSRFDGQYDLICGSRMVDAKSILGVLSLNYKDVLNLRIIDAKSDPAELRAALCPFMLEGCTGAAVTA